MKIKVRQKPGQRKKHQNINILSISMLISAFFHVESIKILSLQVFRCFQTCLYGLSGIK